MSTVTVDLTTRQITITIGSGTGGSGPATWGAITGDIAAQADLQGAFADVVHTHAVDEVINSVGGAYVLGRTNQSENAPSRAVPLTSSDTGNTVVLRESAGGADFKYLKITNATQSGTVLDLKTSSRRYVSLAADQVYTFSNSENGLSMVLEVKNIDTESIMLTFTGAKVPIGEDTLVPPGQIGLFSFEVINGTVYMIGKILYA